MTTPFGGVDRSVCERAWALIQPTVITAAEVGVTERLAGTILVARRTPESIAAATPDIAAELAVFEGFVGSVHANAEYTAFARAKLFTTLRIGRPSREISQCAPHLLAPGMTIWGGSAVREGLVAAFSGVESEYDEMFAEMMLTAIIGLCRFAVNGPGGLLSPGNSRAWRAWARRWLIVSVGVLAGRGQEESPAGAAGLRFSGW